MSAVTSVRRAASPLLDAEHRVTGWVVGLGLVALFFAPTGWGGLVVTAVAGILGMTLPAADDRPAGSRTWAAATALGVGAFLAARQLAVLPAVPVGAAAVVVIVVAAVAEEAFFRRLAYSWCARWGSVAAIVLTTIAFAIVHVPAYGLGALPVDLGAGLIFGWQRWATGSWVAAAVTHAAANLLQTF